MHSRHMRTADAEDARPGSRAFNAVRAVRHPPGSPCTTTYGTRSPNLGSARGSAARALVATTAAGGTVAALAL